jgi:hypothetical protein
MEKQSLVSLDTQLGPWAGYLNAYTKLIKERGYSPASFQTQVESQKQWREEHPDYQKQWRRQNPQQVENNRERQRQRDQKRRLRQRLLDKNNLALDLKHSVSEVWLLGPKLCNLDKNNLASAQVLILPSLGHSWEDRGPS